MGRSKKKYYVVVDKDSKKNSRYIEGAFPFTEEGKKMAEEYANKLNKQGVKYKVSSR
tara:strand:+ start:943 stop:1113 length:171 start_codon:yes stop_codon:yes gene_type:complete